MSISSYKAVVKNVNEIANQVLKIEMELLNPNKIEFRAGQFLMMLIPNKNGKTIKRAYSIASTPSDKENLVFVIKLIPEGKASTYISKLKIGDEVVLEGPFGHFLLKDTNKKDLFFIATGTGIAPIHSMVLQIIHEKKPNQIFLFFGLRSENDIFWHEIFKKLESENDNFHYLITLSRASEKWTGKKGRITDHLREFDFEIDNIQAYICGSIPMVEEVSKILIQKGVRKENVIREGY